MLKGRAGKSLNKKKDYAGNENHSPQQLRKRSSGYRKTPPPKEKINGDQEGCRLDLKPSRS
jgi:hypothetical protein